MDEAAGHLMATVEIPTRTGLQRYSIRCQLGDRYYTLEFRWNARDSSWGFVLSDAVGEVLAAKKVVVGFPLTVHKVDERLPDGEFFAIDTGGEDQDPGLTDLGSRVILTFTDAEDFV
jgi:hypothetical protein